MGRPKSLPDGAVKTMLTLRKDQLLWLDGLALRVKTANGSIIDRGMVVRSLIDSLVTSDIDLSDCTSEHQIGEALKR